MGTLALYLHLVLHAPRALFVLLCRQQGESGPALLFALAPTNISIHQKWSLPKSLFMNSQAYPYLNARKIVWHRHHSYITFEHSFSYPARVNPAMDR